MKSLIIMLLLIVPLRSIAQVQKQSSPPPPPIERSDHLQPVDGFFNCYDFQVEYYSRVRKMLFEKLIDRPEIRFLVMPSFTPENVLEIEYDRNNDKYFLVYHICEKMIWYNKDWDKTKVIEYRKGINKESVYLIKTLFKRAILQTKFYDSELLGLDGETYYFSYFDNGLKTGSIWSPNGRTKMGRLVTIGSELIDLTKKDEIPVLIDGKLKQDILDLTNDL
jgi:hypothetical protein